MIIQLIRIHLEINYKLIIKKNFKIKMKIIKNNKNIINIIMLNIKEEINLWLKIKNLIIQKQLL